MHEDFNKVVKDTGREAWLHLVDDASQTASDKGFWSPPEMMDKYVAKLALIHSEVTEVMEALRKGHGPEKVTEEFADIFIRCFDLHQKLAEEGFATEDLYDVMIAKLEKNSSRPTKHGHNWG